MSNSHCTENEMKDVGNLKHFSVIGNFSDLGNFRSKPSKVGIKKVNLKNSYFKTIF